MLRSARRSFVLWQRKIRLRWAEERLHDQLDHETLRHNTMESTVIDDLNIALIKLGEERHHIAHHQVCRLALRFNIPFPDGSDSGSWERLYRTRHFVLKEDVLQKLRAEIREERKARRDYALGWVTPFVSILSVILGAILGYFLGKRG